jgi:hypothetical protein
MVTTTNVIDVIIGNTLAAGATVDPTNIASKALQLGVASDLSWGGTDGASVKKEQFLIFQGTGVGSPPRISSLIDPTDVLSWQRVAYTAAAAQVSTITVESPTAGREYILYLVDLQDFEYVNKPRKRYAVVAASGETATTLAAKFVTLINQDLSKFCSAGSAAAVITLTGIARDSVSKAYETNFKIALGGSFTTSTTIAYTTAPTKGVGTYDQVFELEEKYKGYKGNMNRSEYVVTPTYYVDPAKTYVSFIIRHRRRIGTQAAGREGMGDLITTYLFIDSTNAAAAASGAGSIALNLTNMLGASKEIKSL